MPEERHDPPPPDLSPPPPSPPPPSLSAPPPAPSMPPVSRQAPPGPPPEEEEGEEIESLLEPADEPGAVARLNPRLVAGLIDGLVAGFLFWVPSMLIPGHWWFENKLGWVLFAAYLAFRDSLPQLRNQSLGKMAMKLKVVKTDGSSMSRDWQTSLIRNVLLVVGLGIVEAIVLIARDNGRDRGQRLGDEWAKTRVVVAGDAESETAAPDASAETDGDA